MCIRDRLRATAHLVILLISHDLDYVRRSADRVLLLDTSVKAVGTPAEVFALSLIHIWPRYVCAPGPAPGNAAR